MKQVQTPKERMYFHAKRLLEREFEFVVEEKYLKDAFGFDIGGDSCEIEIKVCDTDFHKEFTKLSKSFKHDFYREASQAGSLGVPTRFYFMVPLKYKDMALSRMYVGSGYWRYGLITYCRLFDECEIVRKSGTISHENFHGEYLQKPYSFQRTNNIFVGQI